MAISGINKNLEKKLNASFKTSNKYNNELKEANKLKGKLLSGNTKWTKDYDNAVSGYLNREDFSYDASKDTLFQNAMSNAIKQGRTAMQDTLGAASGLTGGYGSSYAVAAANQVYNDAIDQANDNLATYYQLALDAYDRKGQNMINNISVLGDADNKAYTKIQTAYGVQNDFVNNLYNQEFNEYSTELSKNQAMANLLNSDYWQKRSSSGSGGSRSSGGGGVANVGRTPAQYTFSRMDGEKAIFLDASGKEKTFTKGINPVTGKSNPDKKYGTFDNGYQPNNIKGTPLKGVGKGEIYGNIQNVFKKEGDNSTYYIWDPLSDKYVKYDKSDLL